MKKFFATACFFTLIFLFTACANIKEVQYTGVKGFKVNKMDVGGINGDVMLGIKNPNPFGFSIYRSKFDVTYNGVNLGTAKLSHRVHIDANAERTYAFNLKSDFKNANLADIMKLLGGGARGTMQIKGNLKAGKFFLFRKKFPIDMKERVSLDK
jgi:LEA14-like dessication related protein